MFKHPQYILLIVFMSICSAQLKAQQKTLETIIPSGHYEDIMAVDFNEDGSLVLTASKDKTIKLWEVSTGRELRTYYGHHKSVNGIEFSPDEKSFLSVSYDKSAKIWDLITGEIKQSFYDSTDVIRSAIFHPSGKKILTGGHKINATLWDLQSGKKLQTFIEKPSTCYQCIPSLEFSKDGKQLLTGSGDRTVILWNIDSAKAIQKYVYTNGSCSSCPAKATWSPDEKLIASGEGSGQLSLINKENGNVIKVLEADEDYKLVQFSPNGKYLLALVDYYGKLKVWNIKTGKEILFLENKNGKFHTARFNPDGQSILVAGEGSIAHLIQLEDKSEILTLSGLVNRVDSSGLNSSQKFYLNRLPEFKLSPDAKEVSLCKRGNDLIIWNFESGRISKKLKGHDAVVTCMDFSPDNALIATGSFDRNIIIWDRKTAKIINQLEGHSAMLFSVRFSNDGKQLVSTGWDGYTIVWDVESGKRIEYMKVHESSPYSVSFTPNNIYTITGGLDKTLKLSEIDSRTEVKMFIGHNDVVSDIQFAPDGENFVTTSWDGKVKLWDFYSGLQKQKFTTHIGPVYTADFSTDGKYLVTGGDDKTAILWDLESGTIKHTFKGHGGAISYVKITPDNKKLMTASRDGSVKVWELENGKEILTHVTIGENDWLVKTPEGYFDATSKARESIYFVEKSTSYSLDQFFEEFYRPGILQDAMSNTRSIMRKGDLLTKLEASPPPTVEIIAPPNNKQLQTAYAEIMIKILNNGGGINEIRLLHNGKRVSIEQDLKRIPKPGYDMIKTYRLPLVPGNNEFTVSAYSEGRIESQKSTVNVNFEGTQKSANCHILAIGINKYKNSGLNLNYARKDAEAFVMLMQENGKNLFKNVQVHTLYDQEATRENILSKLNDIIINANPEDVFYFFYAGHGGIHENDFYFIPTEAVSLYQQDKLHREAIYAGLLREKFQEIKALKQMVLLDACHAGASTELLAVRGSTEEKALAQLSRSAGVHVLAAAGSEQSATEFGSLKHGVFTYVVLQALNGMADGAPKDEKITIYELKSFIDDQVPELTQKFQGKAQYPYTFSLGNDFPVVLIKSAGK